MQECTQTPAFERRLGLGPASYLIKLVEHLFGDLHRMLSEAGVSVELQLN
jgi:hypothetical protein